MVAGNMDQSNHDDAFFRNEDFKGSRRGDMIIELRVYREILRFGKLFAFDDNLSLIRTFVATARENGQSMDKLSNLPRKSAYLSARHKPILDFGEKNYS